MTVPPTEELTAQLTETSEELLKAKELCELLGEEVEELRREIGQMASTNLSAGDLQKAMKAAPPFHRVQAPELWAMLDRMIV